MSSILHGRNGETVIVISMILENKQIAVFSFTQGCLVSEFRGFCHCMLSYNLAGCKMQDSAFLMRTTPSLPSRSLLIAGHAIQRLIPLIFFVAKANADRNILSKTVISLLFCMKAREGMLKD